MARASSGSRVLDQLHRALDVGEQRGDGFTLALKVFRGRPVSYSNLGLVGLSL